MDEKKSQKYYDNLAKAEKKLQANLALESAISQELTSQATSQDTITTSTNAYLQKQAQLSKALSLQANYHAGIAANKLKIAIAADTELNNLNKSLIIDNARVAAAEAAVDNSTRMALAGDASYQANILDAKILDQQASIKEELVNFAQQQVLEAEKLNDPNQKALDLAQRMKSRQDKINDAMDKYTQHWKDFKEIAQDPKIATGLFLMAATNEAGKFADTIAAASQDIGLSRTQGFELADSMAAANLQGIFFGVTSKQNADAMAGLVEGAGDLKGITGSTILDVSNLARNLGMGEKEAGKLVGHMALVEGSSITQSKATLETVGNLARGAKLPIGKVTKDLADNMELTSKFGNISVAELGKMAVEAGKLGTSLAQMNALGDSLMDIDTARTKAMELSVLLGRQINVDKAQQLIYDGDIEAGYKEMLNQVGGISNFNNMDYYQKKQTADLMGLTTGELEKQLNKAAGLTETGEQQASGLAAGGEFIARQGKFLMDNMQTIAATANLLSLMKGTKIAGYAIDAAHWIKEKAHLLWKATFGGGADSTKAAVPLKADGTPDMRFAVNKVKDKVTSKVKDVVKDKAKGNVSNMVQDKAKDSLSGGDKVAKGPQGIGAKLKDLASGLKAMGKGTFKGIAALALSGPAMLLALPAIPFLAFMGLVPLPMLEANFGFLGRGLTSLGKGFASIMKGLLVLGLLGVAMIPAALAFNLIAGVDAASMLAFSASLAILGLAAAGLGYIFPFVLLGSLALAAVGVAIIPFAKAVSMIPQDIDMLGFAMGAGALGLAGLTMIPGALGFMMMAGALTVFAGALTLLLPLLPVIAALGGLGGELGFGGGGDKDKKKDDDDGGAIGKKLDRLIALVEAGGDVIMDGKKVGNVIQLTSGLGGS